MDPLTSELKRKIPVKQEHQPKRRKQADSLGDEFEGMPNYSAINATAQPGDPTNLPPKKGRPKGRKKVFKEPPPKRVRPPRDPNKKQRIWGKRKRDRKPSLIPPPTGAEVEPPEPWVPTPEGRIENVNSLPFSFMFLLFFLFFCRYIFFVENHNFVYNLCQ